jgi:hypothetical protein
LLGEDVLERIVVELMAQDEKKRLSTFLTSLLGGGSS